MFFLSKNVFIALVIYKILLQVTLHHIKDSYTLIRKFNNVPRVTTIVFHKITSISEIMLIGNGAKGLRLHETLRTWSRNSRIVILTKNKERRKIKAVYRKVKRNFKPEVGEISFGMSFLIESTSFATDNHISTMNSQGQNTAWAHLAGPAQVKIYKTNGSEKGPKPMNLQVLHKSPQKGKFFGYLSQ
jgi:hypothetical protein